MHEDEEEPQEIQLSRNIVDAVVNLVRSEDENFSNIMVTKLVVVAEIVDETGEHALAKFASDGSGTSPLTTWQMKGMLHGALDNLNADSSYEVIADALHDMVDSIDMPDEDDYDDE